MIDKERYFPGYVIEEVLESSQHYHHFLAMDLRHRGQWVTIRALTPELAMTPELRAGFEEACRAQARVHIDGVSSIQEIGASPDYGTFVAMPATNATLTLVDISGLRLTRALQVPPSFYLSILLDATRILDAAHRQNLAHYTVMPDSIILNPNGRITIDHFIEAAMRRKFKLAGTLDDKHSAPEWRRGEQAGVYSDVYAISALLYQLLTDTFQPDEWEPQWSNMLDAFTTAELPLESHLPLLNFFQHTLAERPNQRISNYPQLIRALEDLHAVLGPYQDEQIRKFALDNQFEQFPPREVTDSLLIEMRSLKSDVINLDSLDMDLLSPNFALDVTPTEPELRFDGLVDTHQTRLNHTSSGQRPCISRASLLSVELNDDEQRLNLDETLTSPSQDSGEAKLLHRSSNTFRQQSPMMRSSSTRSPLEVLAKSRYQVLEELGTGGTGSVYKVLDTTLSEVVALKVLKPSLVNDPSWLSRFKSEMRLTRDIDHTYILPSYHLEQLDGLYFFTMKYIDGRNLAQILHDGPMPLPMSLRLLAQVGRALVTAHEQGIIHRDFKPANIMVDHANFHPWLMDFGIAANEMDIVGSTDSKGIGTPFYMAPEQCRGDEITPAADIFSFGVVAYECLTHALPYTGRTPVAIYEAQCTGRFTPIVQTNPFVPGLVANTVESCLEPNAALRPSSMLRVLEAFSKYE